MKKMTRTEAAMYDLLADDEETAKENTKVPVKKSKYHTDLNEDFRTERWQQS